MTTQTMTAQGLIADLNNALSAEYQAVIMYTVYAAAVEGPFRPQLREFFLSEIADELRHSQFLADKVVALGGYPTVEPVPVRPASDERKMLSNISDAELEAIGTYKRLAKAAEELGDIGLSTHLESMVEDETRHYEETVKILAGW